MCLPHNVFCKCVGDRFPLRMTNFFSQGQACEYMASDGGTVALCSAHGRSLTMAELATFATDNGDATQYTYGADPNNPLTWDGNRIFGCLCDPGYTGYDCSLRTCPTGDDPGTYDDHVEVQLIQCLADSGTFTLAFRQAITSPLPFNATALQVKMALESLSTIDRLRVFFSKDGLLPNGTLNEVFPTKMLPDGAPRGYFGFEMNASNRFVFLPPFNHSLYAGHKSPTGACDINGNQVIIISFDTNHGDLPSLQADVGLLSNSINIVNGQPIGIINFFTDGESVAEYKSIMGTTENVECNNRGLCDRDFGICRCFPTWSSSDGSGGPGDLGDCGYRNDLK